MILLDTHVLIWAINDDTRLGEVARATIERSARTDSVAVSAITPWEIALLTGRGRLHLGHEVGAWIDSAFALPGISLVPITPSIAVDSVRLPGKFHADPADRIIISTARSHDVPLVTADLAILAYASEGNVKAVDAAN